MANEIDSLLEQLGLNSGETKIYKHLIRSGPQRAAAISRALRLGRTNTYNHLYLLEAKGLVIRNGAKGVALFAASHPSKLAELFQRKRADLVDAETNLQPVIDKLVPLHEMVGGLPGVYTFYGKDGLHAVYDQILKDGQRIDIIQDRPLFRSFSGSYNDHFVKTRRKRRIRSRVLTPDHPRIKTDDTLELRQVRYLDRNSFPFEMDIKISDRSVALATLKTDNPIGLVISDPEIVRNFRVLFEFLWAFAEE
jgi:sugar-specific transcriptional regulator TrmB